MPPYLQETILGVRDAVARGRLMDDQDLAETYYQYSQAADALRRADPNNPRLSTIHSDDWLPSEADVAELRDATRTVERSSSPTRSNISAQANSGLEVTTSIVVSARRPIDAGRAYEAGVRALYGASSLGSREFPAVIEGRLTIGSADEVAKIDGKDTAIEAKYVEDWSQPGFPG